MLLLALLMPEAAVDTFALLVPIVGPVFNLFGLPFEGAVDWSFFVLAVGALIEHVPGARRAAAHPRTARREPPAASGAVVSRPPRRLDTSAPSA